MNPFSFRVFLPRACACVPLERLIPFALFCGAQLAGLFSNSFATADTSLTGTQPAQWRVVWQSDPATAATVCWTTAERGRSHVLRYRVKTASEPQSVQLADSGLYTGGSVQLYYHRVHLSGLQPDTPYEIQMVSDQAESPVLFFKTAPADGRPFSLLNGGDSRSDREARRRMNSMLAEMVQASFQNEDPADDIVGLAHGGDYIVSGKNMDLWSAWLSDHELTTGDDGRLLPIIPARGNHDHGKPFNEVFGFPEDHLNYYALNIGSRVRFITLNSEISTAGDQANWLAEELKESRPSHRWLVAQYHRPLFPAVKSPGAGLTSWVPLFEKYDVDLVCEADGHVIKRTLPIRNGKHDPTGVVYIGEGGMGVPQRTPKSDRWFLQPPGMADKGNHVFLLTFENDTLRGKCVLEGGQIRDEFVLHAR